MIFPSDLKKMPCSAVKACLLSKIVSVSGDYLGSFSTIQVLNNRMRRLPNILLYTFRHKCTLTHFVSNAHYSILRGKCCICIFWWQNVHSHILKGKCTFPHLMGKCAFEHFEGQMYFRIFRLSHVLPRFWGANVQLYSWWVNLHVHFWLANIHSTILKDKCKFVFVRVNVLLLRRGHNWEPHRWGLCQLICVYTVFFENRVTSH